MKKVLSVLLVITLIVCTLPLGAFSFAASAATSGNYTYEVSGGKVTITDVNTSIRGNVTLPEKINGYTVSKIDDYAFYECKEILSITLPNGLESIGQGAFAFCEKLQKVVLPDTLKSISKGAFSDCVSLGNMEIPKGVEIIEELAFSNCTNLTSVVVPESVTTIGKYAFSWCTALKEISISNVKALEEGAFYCCKILKTVDLGSELTAIEDFTFYNCITLEAITLAEGVVKIGKSAFENCKSLADVRLPGSVANIDGYAFYGCEKIAEVWYSGPESQVKDITIGNFNDSLMNVDWIYNVCKTGEHEYTNNCDSDCNVCGYTRAIGDHVYDNACDKDCNECGIERTVLKHVYYNIYDATCNVCSETRDATPLEWTISVKTTGVYLLKPNNKYTGSFSAQKITVLDKNGGIVKYNDTKGGFPLVKDLQYTVKFNYDCVSEITGTLIWNKTRLSTTIFPDTHAGDWYNDAVTYAVGAGIITGYQNGKFGTSDNIQRQDFLVILARYDGVDLTQYKGMSSGFKDVGKGSYYEAAVIWGVKNGITTGYADGSGKFGVGDKMTREQLVTFLCRYAKNCKGKNVTVSSAKKSEIKSTYKDFSSVSPFSQDAIYWAVSNGVINGKTDTTVVPQGNAQRCEVAKIMYNIFLNNIF